MSEVRVRFTPSSGGIHVANARIALLNYLFARKSKGELVLRLDDIGKDRINDDVFDQITKDLRWLKIQWEEGPNKGGPHGPYRQSLRTKIYTDRLNTLIEKKWVYPCYATHEELEQLYGRQRAKGEKTHYDRRGRNLSEAEKLAYEKQGRKPVWRFNVDPQKIVLNDLIAGSVSFDTSKMEDFIVMNADRTPNTLFASTVDDGEMKISHLLRGRNLLPDVPFQILLFTALGYPVPHFGHLGLIYDTDNQPLSKQDLFDTFSCSHFRQKGFLPESISNYLIQLGRKRTLSYTPHCLDDLIEAFELPCSTDEYVTFDLDELKKINSHCIQNADLIRIADLTLPYLKASKLISSNLAQDDYEYIIKIIDLIRKHVSSLSDINSYASIFFLDDIADVGTLQQMLCEDDCRNILQAVKKILDEEKDLTEIDVPFTEFCNRILELTQSDREKICAVLRKVLTGLEHGPELEKIYDLLPKEKMRIRVEKGLCL